jgi:hypothetical protein
MSAPCIELEVDGHAMAGNRLAGCAARAPLVVWRSPGDAGARASYNAEPSIGNRHAGRNNLPGGARPEGYGSLRKAAEG